MRDNNVRTDDNGVNYITLHTMEEVARIIRQYKPEEYRVVVRDTDSPGCADIRTYTNEASARCAYASLCGHHPWATVKLFHNVGCDSYLLARRYPF